MADTEIVKPAWFEEQDGVFGPEYLLEYEGVLTPAGTFAEVEFLQDVIPPGSRILDVPCGHGRHAIELVARGYDVTGVDLNKHFLEKAWVDASKRGIRSSRLRLLQMDMRKLDLHFREEEFDAAINLFTAMGYFEDDDDQDVFDGVARALKPGGIFVLDFMNPDWLLRNFRDYNVDTLSDRSMLVQERSFDPMRRLLRERRTRIPPDSKERIVREFSIRLYTPLEFARMGNAAGLQLRKTLGGIAGEELTFNSQRQIHIFRKE